jgi:hypothetical protein
MEEVRADRTAVEVVDQARFRPFEFERGLLVGNRSRRIEWDPTLVATAGQPTHASTDSRIGETKVC